MKTLKLKNGIRLENKIKKELTYDTEKVVGTLYLEAIIECKKGHNLSFMNADMVELDSMLHLYMGAAAIIAVNPELAFLDIVNGVIGSDIVRLSNIGRGFFNVQEDASQSSSEELTDNTPENSTQE